MPDIGLSFPIYALAASKQRNSTGATAGSFIKIRTKTGSHVGLFRSEAEAEFIRQSLNRPKDKMIVSFRTASEFLLFLDLLAKHGHTHVALKTEKSSEEKAIVSLRFAINLEIEKRRADP